MKKRSDRPLLLVLSVFLMDLFFFCAPVNAEIKGPASPGSPDVDFTAGREKQNEFEALLEFSGGEKKEGVLYSDFDRVTFSVVEGGKKTLRTEFISNIKEISFLQWRGKARGGKAYIFYPHFVEIILSDGSKLESWGGISEFHKMRFGSGGKFVTYYTFFYDYIRAGKWGNTGGIEPGYPETHPLKGVVVKIVFKKGDGGGGDILRILDFFKGTLLRK